MICCQFIFKPGTYDQDLPEHREAKGQVRRWYDGYRIVVSEVTAIYGDGRLDQPAQEEPVTAARSRTGTAAGRSRPWEA